MDTTPLQSNQVKPNNPISKMILVGVLLLIVLISAFLIYKWSFIKNGVLPSANNPQNVISNTDSNNPLEVFYYIQDGSSYKIFKVSMDVEKADLNTHSFTIAGHYPFIITDSWKKNIILFVTNLETHSFIYSLDISSQNSKPQILLTVPLDSNKTEMVKSARYLDDGNTLAFITFDGESEGLESSVLNIVSLKNHQNKESIPLRFGEGKNPYIDFDFLAATPDSKTIYLQESGADGGIVWSGWYKIDRDTKEVQGLEELPPIAKGEENPTTPVVFSPDRTKLAYADFSAIVDPADLEHKEEYFGPCLAYGVNLSQYSSFGGTVMVQNLNTGTTNEVFRNLSYQNNYCKNIANRIVSFQWLDNSRLAFETIDGVYVIDINTKQQQTLFTFEETMSPGRQTRPSIQSIQLPFILFSDHSIVQINTNKRLEFVAPEAQEGHFFTFE